MTSVSPHRGVIVPMITPTTPAGDVDLAAAERIADRLAHHELSIFVLGTTGEAASVPHAQREPLVAAAVRAAAGRVPVYAGIGDNCAAHSIAAGKRFLELGSAAVVALLPSYYGLTPVEMQAYFELLHREIAGPLMIYNIPITTHLSIPLDVVERLADLPHMVGFKDSEGTAGRLEETAKRLGGRPDFTLLMGIAANATRAMQAGFDGVIPSSASLTPEPWQRFWRHTQAGEWDAAAALQTEFDQVAKLLQRGTTLPHYLAGLKAALAAESMCGPDLFPPLLPLGDADRAALKADLIAHHVLPS